MSLEPLYGDGGIRVEQVRNRLFCLLRVAICRISGGEIEIRLERAIPDIDRAPFVLDCGSILTETEVIAPKMHQPRAH